MYAPCISYEIARSVKLLSYITHTYVYVHMQQHTCVCMCDVCVCICLYMFVCMYVCSVSM